MAAAAATITKYDAALRKSCRAASANTTQRDSLCTPAGGSRRVTHSGRPHRAHAQPMITAVSSDAPIRARTILGAPGNATAVATSTTGLIAGAASMKVKAAAPVAPPSPNSRRATGTDPHSQPGSAAPPTPAATTATAGFRGNQRANRSGDTNTAINPLTTTPSARKGRACTNTPQNTVPAVDSAALSETAFRSIVAEKAQASRMPTNTSIDPTRSLRLVLSVATAPVCQRAGTTPGHRGATHLRRLGTTAPPNPASTPESSTGTTTPGCRARGGQCSS